MGFNSVFKGLIGQNPLHSVIILPFVTVRLL